MVSERARYFRVVDWSLLFYRRQRLHFQSLLIQLVLWGRGLAINLKHLDFFRLRMLFEGDFGGEELDCWSDHEGLLLNLAIEFEDVEVLVDLFDGGLDG